MISSRRLAREWALKILYQMDVGGASLPEARDSALERLRTEFVQLGSRNAIGSTAELICLEFVTSSLSDALPGVRQPFERAATLLIDNAFSAAPLQQEARFEKAFKYTFKGRKLQPQRLLIGGSVDPMMIIDDSGDSTDGCLTRQEKLRLIDFAEELTTNLPLLIAPELRKTARAAVSALNARMPAVAAALNSTFDEELLQARILLNAEATDRWRKVAQIVKKQTTDWFRVGGFTSRLVDLTVQRRSEIDQILSDLASGWKLDRQAAVDRNILRLAALEMLHIPDIPYSASINEAVELAKKFSTNESGRFVNGVLGAVAQRIGEKPAVVDQIAPPDDDIIENVTDSVELDIEEKP